MLRRKVVNLLREINKIKMEQLTREAAMQKFMLAKKRKQEMVSTIKEQFTATYEKETGLKGNYFFAM